MIQKNSDHIFKVISIIGYSKYNILCKFNEFFHEFLLSSQHRSAQFTKRFLVTNSMEPIGLYDTSNMKQPQECTVALLAKKYLPSWLVFIFCSSVEFMKAASLGHFWPYWLLCVFSWRRFKS